ncbi:MAG: hypothetical protein LQ342_003474 [Letrouitia transgressa]|nr:MAG: hypothetical protein LQ342_003474 [Letrouitia transgressa]
MVVRIRLARFGKRNRPFYNIVVAQARSARNSKPMEVIGNEPPKILFPFQQRKENKRRLKLQRKTTGTYDPIPRAPPPGSADEAKPFKDIKIDSARAKYWIGVGAQPSEPAWRLLSMIGLLQPKYKKERTRVVDGKEGEEEDHGVEEPAS